MKISKLEINNQFLSLCNSLVASVQLIFVIWKIFLLDLNVQKLGTLSKISNRFILLVINPVNLIKTQIFGGNLVACKSLDFNE
jgi:hypothetical protein